MTDPNTTTVTKPPMTDAEVDEALHDIGRHLGVHYDERGYAIPPERVTFRDGMKWVGKGSTVKP